MFQSTRPRGARHASAVNMLSRNHVSIHAPARGATRASAEATSAACVSIHAPARGATRCGHDRLCVCMQFQSTRPRGRDCDRGMRSPDASHSFNPRARAGRDDALSARSRRSGMVSIHAPARGATTAVTCQLVSDVFQSTRPRGARRRCTSIACCALQFQSTRPRGARRLIRHDVEYLHVFQSTRPRGARHVTSMRAARRARVSIHAPARGATSRPIGIQRQIRSFNPRAREGRDDAMPAS